MAFKIGFSGCIQPKVNDDIIMPNAADAGVLPRILIKALRYMPRNIISSEIGAKTKFCIIVRRSDGLVCHRKDVQLLEG